MGTAVSGRRLRDVQCRRTGARKVTFAIGGKRISILPIHEFRELGIRDATHFRKTANGAGEGFQRLVVRTALITGEMMADVQRRAVSRVVGFEIGEIGLQRLRSSRFCPPSACGKQLAYEHHTGTA